MWILDVSSSISPSASPETVVAPVVSDPWMMGFWTCFWIYSAVVTIAIIAYQIGYHRWNPFRKKTGWEALSGQLIDEPPYRRKNDGAGKG